MKVIKLPCYDIEITLDGRNGSITSELRQTNNVEDYDLLDASFDGIESLILACACEGIDVSSPAFVRAVETAVESASNHLG